jgi:hypothetical protein
MGKLDDRYRMTNSIVSWRRSEIDVVQFRNNRNLFLCAVKRLDDFACGRFADVSRRDDDFERSAIITQS